MKIFTILILLGIWVNGAVAGEAALATTFQPLKDHASGDILVAAVVCQDWYSHSRQARAFDLISAANVPPTNNPKDAKENLNLASVHGIRFFSNDLGNPQDPPQLRMTVAPWDSGQSGHDRENIVRASLECLRLCLPDQLRLTPVTLEATAEDKTWLSKIVNEFNSTNRSQPFYPRRLGR